ncbi:MAG: hypothetical protein Q4F88_04240 [Eubacteriales bacterium]|nr:hypothetical protein [Eubacteriales bacterium]
MALSFVNKKWINIFLCVILIFIFNAYTFSSQIINNIKVVPKIESKEIQIKTKTYFESSKIYLLHSTTNAQCLSMIINDKNNNVIIFDGGWEEDINHLSEVINSLGGVVRAWYITHKDSDHYGALKAYKKLTTKPFKVENIYEDPRMPLFDSFSDTSIALLNNPYIASEDVVNNSCSVYKVILEGKSILIPGDLGIMGAQNLLKNVDPLLLKSDFLQMPHHGAHYTMHEFYSIVSPKVCLWPTYNNSYYSNENVMRTKQYMNQIGVEDNFHIDIEDIIIQ